MRVLMSITEVNNNFTKAVKKADSCDELVIFKRNKPQYVLINIEENPQIEMTDEEKILFVGQRILHKHINEKYAGLKLFVNHLF